jgi:hypothetical protein
MASASIPIGFRGVDVGDAMSGPDSVSDRPVTNSRSATIAGGIGVGAVLTSIAQSVGTDTALGALILYMVPVVSIFTGALLRFVDLQVKLFFERSILRLKVRSMRRRLDKSESSEVAKRALRRRIAELEIGLIEDELWQLRSGTGNGWTHNDAGSTGVERP